MQTYEVSIDWSCLFLWLTHEQNGLGGRGFTLTAIFTLEPELLPGRCDEQKRTQRDFPQKQRWKERAVLQAGKDGCIQHQKWDVVGLINVSRL